MREDEESPDQKLRAKPPQQEPVEQEAYTDNVVYNRLPKNFFVQEAEEQFDLTEVMRSIQHMRNEFQGYISETKVQEKLDYISDMILQPPEQFIDRHMKALGLDRDQLLYEQVIS